MSNKLLPIPSRGCYGLVKSTITLMRQKSHQWHKQQKDGQFCALPLGRRLSDSQKAFRLLNQLTAATL
jgi:hypothetical protein